MSDIVRRRFNAQYGTYEEGIRDPEVIGYIDEHGVFEEFSLIQEAVVVETKLLKGAKNGRRNDLQVS